MMTRFLALALVAALSWPAASAASAAEPDRLVRETTEAVLAILKEDSERVRSDPGYLYGVVEEVVLPKFDFEEMTRLAVGKHWQRADPAQRASLVREFKTLLVRTYSKALQEYTDQAVLFLPMRGDAAAGDVTVRTEIEQPGGFPIPVNYSLYRQDGQWKVYDVVIDGVSLVTNYRTSFSQKIRAEGVDGLIAQLRQRNRE